MCILEIDKLKSILVLKIDNEEKVVDLLKLLELVHGDGIIEVVYYIKKNVVRCLRLSNANRKRIELFTVLNNIEMSPVSNLERALSELDLFYLMIEDKAWQLRIVKLEILTI